MSTGNLQKNETAPAFGEQDTVQVLALDGGGLRGTFSASVIKSLESQLGHSICEHFDILTGTSTGGLIALALALGLSGQDVQRFYVENGRKIFPCVGFNGVLRAFRWFCMPKYSNKTLKQTLMAMFSDADGNQPLLKDSCKRLVIPTFRAGESIPRLLKTPHADRYKADWKMPMWAVGLATSAAPTYLPGFEHSGKQFLDGGLWANNPSLVGVVEARDLGASMDRIRVLNIGTTYSRQESVYCYPLSRMFRFLRFRRGGIVSWGKYILPTVMQACSYATANMYLHRLLSPGNSVVIDRQLDSGDCGLDNVDILRLVEMGESAGETSFSHLKEFFDHHAPAYTPSEEALAHGI